MPTVQQIRDLKEVYTTELYELTRKQQKLDQSYYDDTFDVPEVREPHRVYRSGIGPRMINNPAEQMVTSNPQALIELLKGNRESQVRMSEEINQHWLELMRYQNPNPPKEFIKNCLKRGEAYIRLTHNENWKADKATRVGSPVRFAIPDSQIIYSSPEEDENGIPKRVIVFYERSLQEVQLRFPDWKNPLGRELKDKVEWFEFWEDNMRYFEADSEAVLKTTNKMEEGIQTNIYGFPPFIRRYSGFGSRSVDGELSSLIVGDLRYVRDLIHEECALRSEIVSMLHLFAHRARTIISEGELNEDDIKNLSFGNYDINILQNVPPNTKIAQEDANLPSAEIINHLAEVNARIERANPFLITGPFGSSGRQQDMASSSAMRRYATVLENTETAFGVAIQKAIELTDKIPGLRPPKLTEADYKPTYKVTLSLKDPDPVEKDRLVTLGERLWNNGQGSIDLETNHIQFQGRTPDESDKIKAKMLVDKLTIFNPDVAAVMGMVFAEETGMDRWLEEAKMRAEAQEANAKGLQNAEPATTTERRQGETGSQLGREMIDMSLTNRGARQSPERFTRGG